MEPPPSSFPVASLGGGNKGETSPAELLEYLQTIINSSLSDDGSRIPAGSKDSWLTLILELSEHFLASFPSSAPGCWGTLTEKANLAVASLNVMERASAKVDELLLASDIRSQTIVIRLLLFLLALASWEDVRGDGMELSPKAIQWKAIEVFDFVMHNFEFGDDAACAYSHFFGNISQSCISLLREQSDLPVGPYPIKLAFIDMQGKVANSSHRIDIEVESPSHLCQVSAIVLLIASVLQSRNRAISLESRYSREIVYVTKGIFDKLFSSTISLSHQRRSEALSILLQAVKMQTNGANATTEIVRCLPTVALITRLEDGPQIGWEQTDKVLQDLFGKHGMELEPGPSFTTVLEVLNNESWGPDGVALRDVAYYALSSSASVKHQERSLSNAVLHILRQKPSSEALSIAIKSFEIYQGNENDGRNVTGGVLGKRKREEIPWKKSIIDMLRIVIDGDSDNWQPPEGLQDSTWKSRLLDALRFKLSEPLSDDSAAKRVHVLETLKQLPCLLSHPGEACSQSGSRQALSLIPCYLTCLSKLAAEATYENERQLHHLSQDCMAACLRHHSQGYAEDQLDAVVEFIKRGMEANCRSVRIASGRTIMELIRLYIFIGRGASKRFEHVFEYIFSLLSIKKDTIRETTIICLGLLGRLSESDVLGRVLSSLVLQLDLKNILLKGIAYCQLLSLATHHKKTPYLLVSPFMTNIAPTIVSTMAHRPNLLIEMCRFLSISPSDFLSVTSDYTLPSLFGTCNAEALRKMSDEVGKPLSSLFLVSSAEVLAHVFSLNGASESDRSLNFIMRTLKEAANNAIIETKNVVKSCLIPLLAKLIVSMGDENRIIAENAATAIQRVERSLISLPEQKRSKATQHLGNFLKDYMLGIITNLSDILQDVLGRKSVDMKRNVLRGLDILIREVGAPISAVAPQIMATLQTTVSIQPLSEVALRTWHTFLTTLTVTDLGPHVGPTTAALVNVWSSLSSQCRDVAKQCIDYIVSDIVHLLGPFLEEIADFSGIEELEECTKTIEQRRSKNSTKDRLLWILDRTSSDNNTVVCQSLCELKTFMMAQQQEYIRVIASGDVFDPVVGQVTKALLGVACRDGENVENGKLPALECLGILGAVDPDRFDLPVSDSGMVVRSNFQDETESIEFALHLIENALVGAFRSTSDIKYQSHLAFAIQELLKFCGFSPKLVTPGTSVPNKVRKRWAALPKHVLETVTPLLEGKFAVQNPSAATELLHPIYHTYKTYREWIQCWSTYLIPKTNNRMAKSIFDVFRIIVRNKDVGIAHQLLPHVVLNILISGDDVETDMIRLEITTVLEDQLNPQSASSSDKRLLSAQAIFMLMDHLNKWIRIVRQEVGMHRSDSKRSKPIAVELLGQLSRVDSILSSIDQDLIAKAAFECKSYARSLMNFEKQIVSLKSRNSTRNDLHVYYERLHEIYAHLDEPDGMEGVSVFISLPSIEHQIREHESTGRWTSAQSCWEVRLQQSPDQLEYHVGLLRCLRNLGHYDSLRTHIQGILVRYPKWEKALSSFKVEGALMNSDWEVVQALVSANMGGLWEIDVARLLLAMRAQNTGEFSSALQSARAHLGAHISAAGERGYRRAYDAMVKLHLLHDIEMLHNSGIELKGRRDKQDVSRLFVLLSARLGSTLPTFRTREPMLSMHRTTFALSRLVSPVFMEAIGRAWLDSSKIARKSGHWQTAYSAVLQAQESRAPYSFFQRVKLAKATGEPLRALYDLDYAMTAMCERRLPTGVGSSIELTTSAEHKMMEAKARLLRVRWMSESGRFDANLVAHEFTTLCSDLSSYESVQFRAGHFQDECFKTLGPNDMKSRGARMNMFTVKAYVQAIKLGSKYTYQTIPRLITLWLDMGEDPGISRTDVFSIVNDEIQRAIKEAPVYKWLTAFPQIVSRVDHKNEQAFDVLALLIVAVLSEFPQQGLWSFISVVKSTKQKREKRGNMILDRLKATNHNTLVPILVDGARLMATELLNLCDKPIKDDAKALSMSKDCPALAKLAPSQLIIPLQESMTASLPSTSSSCSIHQPFPPDAPTIAQFYDVIDIMRSLAKPRKITIVGSDGKIYMFLGKPKDDLRKDARLMDFNSIINKLLKTNSESRRRQLHIRTYSVVTLNEECGFIQWVPNTTPMRPILMKYYVAKSVEPWSKDMQLTFAKIKEVNDKEAGKIFRDKVLSIFPPVFHEWFLDTFPEPTAWLSSRLSYGRTAAVMSMVGFILGLGDRHLENILLDVCSGDAIHVDFNCLFEKGKTLETPERVPFRLTQNMVDGLGITGIEGNFRKACEITLQLLRDNKDALMSVLDAFIHDPLVEWEDERRKKMMAERTTSRPPTDRNAVKQSTDLRSLAKNALNPIEKKLRGVYGKDSSRNREKEVSTSNLVQILIEEAMDLRNLSKMYPGWAPWH